MTTLSRRALLKAGLAVGGGLLVEVSLPQAQAAAAEPVTFQPNGLLRITSNDVVTFVLLSVEMGQGVSTLQRPADRRGAGHRSGEDGAGVRPRGPAL